MRRAMILALGSCVLAALGGACGSFGATDPPPDGAAPEEAGAGPDEAGTTADSAGDVAALDGGAPDGDAQSDASVKPCPTRVVFSDTFDTGAGLPWISTLSGSGMFLTEPGKFVSMVSAAQGVAVIDYQVTLPTPVTVVCIALDVRVTANAADFSDGGYVATNQTDVRLMPGDATSVYLGLGLGVDQAGVFTKLFGSGIDSTLHPGIPIGTFTKIVYRLESQGGSSLVSVRINGLERAAATLSLASVGEIRLELGASTSTTGTRGAVTFALDSILITAP
jgi:hypothetical protein